MLLSDCGLHDQIFTHRDDAMNGLIRHFNASAIYRAIILQSISYERIRFPMDEEHYNVMMSSRGVEETRVKRLSRTDMLTPVLVARMPCHTDLIIDGTHRYVKLWRLGIRELKGFYLQQTAWEPYLLTLPEELNISFTQKAISL